MPLYPASISTVLSSWVGDHFLFLCASFPKPADMFVALLWLDEEGIKKHSNSDDEGQWGVRSELVEKKHWRKGNLE